MKFKLEDKVSIKEYKDLKVKEIIDLDFYLMKNVVMKYLERYSMEVLDYIFELEDKINYLSKLEKDSLKEMTRKIKMENT